MTIIQSFQKVVCSKDSVTRDYYFSISNILFPISLNLKESNKLVVFFPGAFNLNLDMPKFQRKGYFSDLPYNCISFFDPTLFMHKNLAIGWFQGNQSIDLFQLTSILITDLCQNLNIDYNNVLFFGTSAGGIPTVKVGKKFNNSNIYLGNIQTDILKYYPNAVNSMLSKCYPNVENLSLYKHKLDLYYDIGNINVFYTQNIYDSFHYKNHFLPIQNTFRKNFQKTNFIIYENTSTGHNPPPKEIEIQLIKNILENIKIDNLFN